MAERKICYERFEHDRQHTQVFKYLSGMHFFLYYLLEPERTARFEISCLHVVSL